MGRGTEGNLIPLGERSREERREIGRKGGIASGKARRLKKAQAEILRQVLACEITDKEAREKLIANGMEPTIAAQINFVLAEKAAEGSVTAAQYIRDTIGEKPKEGMDWSLLQEGDGSWPDLSRMTDEELVTWAKERGAGEE